MAKRGPHRRWRRARLLAAETEKSMNDARLLEAALAGDEDAFARLVERHRRALHAHCYRMLGSVADAEDVLQEALLNAWRGLAKFEGRSSLRSWLYTIATNACLRAIERRPKRVLPIDYAPAADPHDGLAEPLVESVWLEPYPDEHHGLEDGLAGPEARYEQRECSSSPSSRPSSTYPRASAPCSSSATCSASRREDGRSAGDVATRRQRPAARPQGRRRTASRPQRAGGARFTRRPGPTRDRRPLRRRLRARRRRHRRRRCSPPTARSRCRPCPPGTGGAKRWPRS